jgi:hypothetical protein
MKAKFLIIVTALTVLLSAFSILMPINSIPDFGKLDQKKWYKTLFTKSEIKKLDKAEKTFLSGESNLIKGEDYFKQADVFTKRAENATTVSQQNDAYKNAAKLEEKAVGFALKGFASHLEANIIRHDIFKSKLNSARFDTSLYHVVAQRYFDEAEKQFKQADIMYKNAQNFERKQKYTFVKESIELQNSSIKKLEFAICLYMKDSEIDMTEFKPKKIVDNVVDSNKISQKDTSKNNSNLPEDLVNNKTNDYNPADDKNVYKSKLEFIISKLTLINEDNSKLASIINSNEEANNIMKSVEKDYVVIDSITAASQKESDKIKSEMIYQQATELEKNTFFKMIKASNLYIKSNDIKYNFYKKHLANYGKTETSEIIKSFNKYVSSADSIYSYSQSTVANANLQFYKSEEYLQLMDAIQAQLASIQQQENAFCSVFDWNIVELPASIDHKYSKDFVVKNDSSRNDENIDPKVIQKQKYEYNYAGSFEYSNENPKPDTLKIEKGIVFKIQVGVFKDLLSLKDFGKYSPISFDTYVNNPYKRFMLGKYKSSEAAEIALKEITEKRYKDAFIIAYIDGKRTLYSKAKNLIVADDKYKNDSKNEINNINSKNNSQTNEKTDVFKNINYGTGKYDFAQGKDVSIFKGLVYGVQLGMYQLPKTNEELKMTTPLMQENTKAGMKFINGPFYSYIEAVNKNNELISKGFDKSFVTSYFDGKHISLTQAKSVEASGKKEKIETVKKDSLFFSVQIGAYSTKLSENDEKQFKTISEKYTISAIADQNGLVIYTVGKYKTYEESLLVKNEIKKLGTTDGFVVAFLNNKKITVQEAIKISKTKN